MEKREERRDRTWRAARRHQRDHHTFCYRECFCKPLGHYAKMGCQTHRCAGRKHGQPKLGVGLCKGWDRRPGLKQRQAWRQLVERGELERLQEE